MSIAKAQAEALAERFLDGLGTGKEGLRPRESFAEIILLAGEFIEDCQNNLNAANNNASGALSESLIAGEPKLDAGVFKLDVLMNFYGKFQNKGVKGTRSGKSLSGYSFKNEGVSKKMLQAIKAWLDRGKMSTRSVKKYEGYGDHEIKNKKLAKLSEADAAYAVARGIKIHGIKPTGFLDKAAKTTTDKVAERLGAALQLDVTDSISNI